MPPGRGSGRFSPEREENGHVPGSTRCSFLSLVTFRRADVSHQWACSRRTVELGVGHEGCRAEGPDSGEVVDTTHSVEVGPGDLASEAVGRGQPSVQDPSSHRRPSLRASGSWRHVGDGDPQGGEPAAPQLRRWSPAPWGQITALNSLLLPQS